MKGAKVDAIKIHPPMGFNKGKFHKVGATNVNTSRVIPRTMNGSLIVLIFNLNTFA
jgi:hypothetical protein